MQIHDSIAKTFVESFDGYVAEDVATALTCAEVDSLVALLREMGADEELAFSWLSAHAVQDDEGDAHWELRQERHDG